MRGSRKFRRGWGGPHNVVWLLLFFCHQRISKSTIRTSKEAIGPKGPIASPGGGGGPHQNRFFDLAPSYDRKRRKGARIMKMAVKSIILFIRKSLIRRINEVYVFFNKIYRGYFMNGEATNEIYIFSLHEMK